MKNFQSSSSFGNNDLLADYFFDTILMTNPANSTPDSDKELFGLIWQATKCRV